MADKADEGDERANGQPHAGLLPPFPGFGEETEEPLTLRHVPAVRVEYRELPEVEWDGGTLVLIGGACDPTGETSRT